MNGTVFLANPDSVAIANHFESVSIHTLNYNKTIVSHHGFNVHHCQ